jgi:hypothetical protein
MLLLTSTSDKVQVITDAAGAVKVHASWVDNLSGTITPGRTNTASITTAATTDVVASPAASTQRNLKKLSVRNTHASVSQNITVQHTDGTNVEEIWKGQLAAGEGVVLDAVGGWTLYDLTGPPKSATAKVDVCLHVSADVTNATTSFADVTGLTYPVKSGKKYAFEAHLFHVTNATTTGAQFGINGPAMTYMRASQLAVVTPSVTAAAMANGVAAALDTAGAAETTGPGATEAEAILSGYIEPSADGTFAIRLKSEVAVAAGLVVRKGSWLWLRECND